MTIPLTWDGALARLDQYRAVLLGQVADELTYTIPLLAVPPTAADLAAYHQRQMYETVARLHDYLQTARLHEQLLVDEFVWAAGTLPHWGVTVAHIAQMINCYLDTAQRLGTWEAPELGVLGEIRAYLLQIAHTTFSATEEPSSVEAP